MKTQIRIQDSLRIDPIPYQIKGFSFSNLKAIVDIQELICSYSLHEISLSNTPWIRKLI